MMAQRTVEVAFPPKKPIHCLYSAKDTDNLRSTTPALIFTHGAGGTLQSDAVANFVNGFISAPEELAILCFQGNMNLKSRVKMFTAVIDASNTEPALEIKTTAGCLGGRSMGARAAVMAATKETTHLVLVSYPLHTDKEVRDEILLGLPDKMKVIFVSGDHDTMCNLEKLEELRNKMTCDTWRVVVQDTDHGMNSKPKAATEEIGKATGTVVSHWLESSNVSLREGRTFWDAEAEVAQWSGWLATPRDLATDGHQKVEIASGKASQSKTKPHNQSAKVKKKLSSRKRKESVEEGSANGDVKPASKKGRKI